MDESDENRFELALRELTTLHGATVGLFACVEASERAFADGLRVGDQVRRAVRQGRRDRPGASDVEAITAITGRLREAALGCLASAEVARFREALAAGTPADVASAARAVFADLESPEPVPARACRGLRLRRRQRGFETLVAPAALAAEIVEALLLGRPEASEPPAGDEVLAALARLPEPVILDRGPDGSGSEVSLSWALADLRSEPLLCLRTGDLWFFEPDPVARAAVAIASEPEDEWWQASEIPWRDWSSDLRRRLADHAIEVLDYSSSLPQKNGSRPSRMRGVMK